MFYYSDSALDWQYQQPKTSIVEKTTDYSVIRELKVIPIIALRIRIISRVIRLTQSQLLQGLIWLETTLQV